MSKKFFQEKRKILPAFAPSASLLVAGLVCAVTTALRILYQGTPNYGQRAKSDTWSHFIRPQSKFCQ